MVTKNMYILPLAVSAVLVLGMLYGEGYPKKVCVYTRSHLAKQELFKSCMSDLRDMRKGTSYTTNDDEDLDEAISQCEVSAERISSARKCVFANSSQEANEYKRKN